MEPFNSPIISISIPVYNVEKYLCQCIESIINQSLIDIEIILVDDGSTDSCGGICDKYAAKDSRIKVIHKENGGLASARQAALEIATGIYFCACDADDWVESDMYEQMYNKAQETGADIIICDYYIEYDNGETVHKQIEKLDDSETDLIGNALNGKLPTSMWNKIYKREIFQKYNISWEQGIDLGEDFLISLKIFRNPVTINYIQKPLYHYRRLMNGNSYTNDISLKTFNQNVFIRDWINNHIDVEKYENAIFRLWLNSAFTGLRVKDGINPTYYNQNILANIPFLGFFKYHYPKIKGLLVILTKLFGYHFGRFIYRLLYKFFYK